MYLVIEFLFEQQLPVCAAGGARGPAAARQARQAGREERPDAGRAGAVQGGPARPVRGQDGPPRPQQAADQVLHRQSQGQSRRDRAPHRHQHLQDHQHQQMRRQSRFFLSFLLLICQPCSFFFSRMILFFSLSLASGAYSSS